MRGPIQSGLGKAMLSDLEVVLAAVERSDPSKLEGLETGQSTMQFLFHNMDRVRGMTSELDELDLSSMNLRHLPVYGMLQMASLRKLVLDGNWELKISQGDIEVISRLPIEEVSIFSSDIDIETFRALQGLPRLTKLNLSFNKLLSTYTGNNRFGDLTSRLVELNVSRCDLSSEWLDDIFRCTSLKSLNISGNDGIGVDHTNFSKLKNLKSLKRLDVYDLDLTTASLNEICKSGGLEELGLGCNKQVWKGEVDFGECRRSLMNLNVGANGTPRCW